MGNTFYFEWEVRFMEWLQSFENAVLNVLARVFSMMGEEIVLIALMGMLYWCIDKKLAKRVALSVIAAFIWSALFKGAFLRRRPYMDHDSLKCLYPPHSDGELMDPIAQGFSCPSMHSSLSASVFGTIGLIVRKKAAVILGILMPLFIGCSRFYVGVHYPTDVASGWAIGVISIFLIQAMYDKLKDKRRLYLVLVVMALPGLLYCRDVEYFSCLGVTIGFIFSFLFEEKYVNFSETRTVHKFILRIVFGLAVFMLVNTLIKALIAMTGLTDGNYAGLLLRTLRYALAVFVSVGLYPLAFDKTKLI